MSWGSEGGAEVVEKWCIWSSFLIGFGIVYYTSFARDWRAFNLSLRKAPFVTAKGSALASVTKKEKEKKKKRDTQFEKALARFSVERAL